MEVVIVTGAGGPAGVSVIQALRALGHQVIGVDSADDAVGLRLADFGAVIPRSDSKRLAASLYSLQRRFGATALISTIPDEMVRLDSIDIPHWFPSPLTLDACDDKWLFSQVVRDAVAVPPTALDAQEIPGPWVIKPRRGSGSKGIRYIDDLSLLVVGPNEIVQTVVTGREFTADCLVGRDGQMIICVPRWRIETRGGISIKGITFVSQEVADACQDALIAVGLTGIANIQGFVQEDGVVIIECNPRFSGGLPLTIAAGANLPDAYLRMIHSPAYLPEISYKDGVRMTRYFAEIIDNV